MTGRRGQGNAGGSQIIGGVVMGNGMALHEETVYLAPAYVLLASQESSFVTGHIYDVPDGKART